MNIEELPSGKFRARVYLGKIDGKKKYKTFCGTDKKKVSKDAADFEYYYKFNDEISSDMKLEQAMTSYIDSRSNLLSPTTINEYLKIKRTYFKELMPLNLSKITNTKVQFAINTISKKLAPKTVYNVYGLLFSTLKMFAPELRLSIQLPKAQEKPIILPTSASVEVLLEKCKGTDLEIAILLASLGSLRRSEICALTSDDVFDTYIRVDKANVYDKDYNVVTKPTKTYKSREIPLPKFLIDRLKTIDGKIVKISPSTVTNQYIKLRNECGFKTSFHKLRHYYASVLHSLGVPDQYVCKRGGWSTPKTLQKVYQHTMDENDAKVDLLTSNFFSEKFDK